MLFSPSSKVVLATAAITLIDIISARSITPYSKLFAKSARGTPQNDAIIYASNGTTTFSSNGTAASVVVLDFGRNVEGKPTFEVVSASGDTSVFEISYGETEAAFSVYMVRCSTPFLMMTLGGSRG